MVSNRRLAIAGLLVAALLTIHYRRRADERTTYDLEDLSGPDGDDEARLEPDEPSTTDPAPSA